MPQYHVCHVCNKYFAPPPVVDSRASWKGIVVEDAAAGHDDGAKRVTIDLYGADRDKLEWAILLLETYDIDCHYDSATVDITIEDKP